MLWTREPYLNHDSDSFRNEVCAGKIVDYDAEGYEDRLAWILIMVMPIVTIFICFGIRICFHSFMDSDWCLGLPKANQLHDKSCKINGKPMLLLEIVMCALEVILTLV